MLALMASSCSDMLVDEQENAGMPGTDDGKGLDELVMFSVGTTENIETRANTRYMPDGYRFICRMFYKAQTGSDFFDVDGGSDQTAWLKVSGSVGNSLYWNKAFNPVNTQIEGKGGVDTYGNDYSAPAFYWQNRKEHAFLAWTDLNNATSIQGGSARGSLKFDSDSWYKVYTGETSEVWTVTGYRIYGNEQVFPSESAMREYVEKTYTTDEAIVDFNNTQITIGNQYDWSDYYYEYMFGWSCKRTVISTGDDEVTGDKNRNLKWYRYMMFFDKVEFAPEGGNLSLYVKEYDKDNTVIVKLKKDGKYVAEAEVTNAKNDYGKYIDGEGIVITDPAQLTYKYYSTDESGNVLYDETSPRYTFYYQKDQEKKVIDAYDEYPVLAFDLTRGSKNSMDEQPDIAQAKTIQAPVGATQESNRVNLYFKHQFSQIQVNVKNAADNSVDLNPGLIEKVELLGVSEEGYVFTELDKEGNVRDAAYKDIDFSKYTEQQLKKNPFGTSFQMFPMSEAEVGSLKSFNAIAFGQLQAIRVTWNEEAVEGKAPVTHESTFRIPSTDLMNLQSGVKYIWNIEIRRGTLAIIRTEIVDWELPEDEVHNGSTDGTIQN